MTDHRANTVSSIGGIGALHERAPFTTQWLFWSIGVYRGLGISPFRMKRIANFFQADLLPQHPPRIFVFGLIYSFDFLC